MTNKYARTWYQFRELIDLGKSDEEIISIVANDWDTTKWKASQMLEEYYNSLEEESI